MSEYSRGKIAGVEECINQLSSNKTKEQIKTVLTNMLEQLELINFESERYLKGE